MDTREKRASAVTWFTPLPLPDGTVGQGDRAQVSWVYSIPAAPATSLRHRVSGREPARSFSARRPASSVSGREPATTASGRIQGAP